MNRITCVLEILRTNCLVVTIYNTGPESANFMTIPPIFLFHPITTLLPILGNTFSESGNFIPPVIEGNIFMPGNNSKTG